MNSDVAKQRGWRWTARRISRGGPAEAAWRVWHVLTVARWTRTKTRPRTNLAAALSTVAPRTSDPISYSADSVHRTTLRADEIMQGRLVVLGTTRTDLAEPDWNSDAQASVSLGPDRHDRPPNISLKHVWELSRLAPLVDLSLAFHVTGDAAYATRVQHLLTGWTEALEDRSSVLWGSGVEASLRLISLSRIGMLLATDPESRAYLENSASLALVVDRHMDRLARFPSRFSSANNHALVEAAGLLVGAIVFNPTGKVQRWESLGLSRLLRQIGKQIDGAGLTREKAADYHGFVTEVVALTLAAYDQAGQPRPAELTDALLQMQRGVVSLIERGQPRFGDGDDSSVFGSDTRPPLARSLELSAAVLVNEPAALVHGVATIQGELLRAGARNAPLAQSSLPVVAPTATPAMSDDRLARTSWLTTIRTTEAVAVLRTGTLGYLSVAAHAHADLTSVVLSVAGQPVLIDPGTFSYDSHPGWRQWFRSTAAHNCLTVNDTDQAEYWGPFLWGTAPEAMVVGYNPHQRPSTATVEHNGYQALGYRTVRSAEIGFGRLTLTDRIVGQDAAQSSTNGSICLTFDPVITLVSHTDGEAVLTGPGMLGQIRVHCSPGWRLEVPTDAPHDQRYSPSFGVLAQTTILRLHGPVSPDRPLTTIIEWGTKSDADR